MDREHNITNKNYDFFSIEYFFGLDNDPIRLIIMIFILISFILTIFIIYMLRIYRKERDFSSFSQSGVLTLNILVENFFRTFSYIFNWLIKNNNTKIEIDEIEYNIGALLNGNPSNFSLCILQGFLLLFLSMSQDILINIFFLFVNMEQNNKKQLFTIIIMIAGYIFPVSVTFYYYKFDMIGINEKFCYIVKYSFTIDNDKDDIVTYDKENYKIYVLFIFIIRTINFFFTFVFIISAIKYLKNSKKDKNDKKAGKLISSLPVLIVSCFSLFVEIIFRILSFIHLKYEEKFIGIYIIMNSIDSILLPLSFFLKHKIYRYFLCCLSTKFQYSDEYNDENNESSIKDIEISSLIPPEKLKELELNELNF